MKHILTQSELAAAAGNVAYALECEALGGPFLSRAIMAVEGDAIATKQLQEIVQKIIQTAKDGFPDRLYRYEGSPGDHLCALPENLKWGCRVRLFLLKLTDNCIVVGGGGLKVGIRTYQEDPTLNWHAEALQKLNSEFARLKRMKQFRIGVDGRIQVQGNLQFEIEHEQLP
ncbi:MAG: hypothetical protein WC326_08235 [Candidatus Delongbacteria bacterium]